MPKIPGISQKDAVRVFIKMGYHIARKSGHIIMSNGKIRLVNPHDSKAGQRNGCKLRGGPMTSRSTMAARRLAGFRSIARMPRGSTDSAGASRVIAVGSAGIGNGSDGVEATSGNVVSGSAGGG